MNLPQDFVNNIQNAFGERGKLFLTNLPALLKEAADRWELSPGRPFLLSYNYVCAVERKDHSEAVLKVGVPNRELNSEIRALRLFNGDGACRLLEADEKRGMLLLERLRPGKMLVTLENDDQRTEIAAEVMLHLWRQPPKQDGFILLSDWFGELRKLRPRFSGGTGPFPGWLVEHVEARLPELFATSNPPRLIHGDFHHFNVLSSDRGWLAIDPKGVIGPPEYEVGSLLLNPIPDLPYRKNAVHQTERRISILSERLGFSRERIRDWAICHTLLSTWWDLSENGTGGEYGIACAEMLHQAKI